VYYKLCKDYQVEHHLGQKHNTNIDYQEVIPTESTLTLPVGHHLCIITLVIKQTAIAEILDAVTNNLPEAIFANLHGRRCSTRVTCIVPGIYASYTTLFLSIIGLS